MTGTLSLGVDSTEATGTFRVGVRFRQAADILKRISELRDIPISVFDPESSVPHIDRVMNWLPFATIPRFSSGRSLFSRRDSLSTSIVRPVENRREDSRLAVAGRRVGMAQQDWILVNMSESGMAIRVWGEAPFARDEEYVISLRAGAQRVEVEGRVRWTRSSWHRDLLSADRRAYCQTAGFSIADDGTAEQQGRWQALREIAQEKSVRVEIGLVTQYRQPRRDAVVVPFRLRVSSS